MKKIISKVVNNPKVFSILSVCVLTMSAIGANAPCYAIYHDVEKPKALETLKKF